MELSIDEQNLIAWLEENKPTRKARWLKPHWFEVGDQIGDVIVLHKTLVDIGASNLLCKAYLVRCVVCGKPCVVSERQLSQERCTDHTANAFCAHNSVIEEISGLSKFVMDRWYTSPEWHLTRPSPIEYYNQAWAHIWKDCYLVPMEHREKLCRANRRKG